jgi:signal peptidase I
MVPNPPKSVIHYTVVTNGERVDPEVMKEKYDVDVDKGELQQGAQPYIYYMALTEDSKKEMEKLGYKVFPTQNIPAGAVFPYDEQHRWTRDNYGPIWIPKKGAALQLTTENYPLYERAIRVYEHNDFEMRNGKFYLNGKETTSYTFKMNYYWMMGDNRQGSQDSRYWGFVPEDRVVGKAWLIWFSWEDGPRWNRLFRIVK